MKILGLDIGTTTISAVVADGSAVLDSLTLPNGSFLPTEHDWEKIQDPNYICTTALQAVKQLFDKYADIARIGITGQMHGIVYLNEAGQPVSPLYTWQDGRGDQLMEDGISYVNHMSQLTGYPLATGYGLVTHFYNLKNGLVPENARVFCTIHDYIAMVLANQTTPVTEASDGASFGLFRVEQGDFDLDAVMKVGISPEILPQVAKTPYLGDYRDGVPVYAAIGDNQASFLGSVGTDRNAVLMNIGTGSQFSVFTENYMVCPDLETRPFPGGGYLVVGAALCGGRAYALLEKLFRSIAGSTTGTEVGSCYDAMNDLLAAGRPDDLPAITPLFQGTRQKPALRGSITGLSTENFTPTHLLWAMLEGMTKELCDMYDKYLEAGGQPARLVGSGNGLRKNKALQDCFCRATGQPMVLSACREEAATGAAIYASMQ